MLPELPAAPPLHLRSDCTVLAKVRENDELDPGLLLLNVFFGMAGFLCCFPLVFRSGGLGAPRSMQ
jgi:hypothetical protein